MTTLHKRLEKKFGWYKRWHRQPNVTQLNFLLLAAVALLMTGFIYVSAQNVISDLDRNPAAAVQSVSTIIKDYNANVQKLARQYESVKDPATKQSVLNQLSQVITKRKSYVLTEIKNNPENIHAVSLPEEIKTILPSAVQGDIEQDIDVQGQFQILHADDFKNPKNSRMEYVVTDSSTGKPYTVHVKDKMELMKIQPGSKVRVHGKAIDSNMAIGSPSDPMVMQPGTSMNSTMSIPAISIINPPASLATLTGNQTELVILVNFNDSHGTPFTIADIKATVFDRVPSSVNYYYKESSGNRISFSGDVIGWYTISMNSSSVNCSDTSSLNTLATQANAKAVAAGINPGNYARVLYVTSTTPCGGIAGTGFAPGTKAYSWGFNDYLVMGHEIGHNINAGHSSGYSCGAKSIDNYTGCSINEYGDPSDIMSVSTGLQWNGPHKVSNGWIPSAQIQTVTVTGRYTIAPLESTTTSATQILKIRKPNGGQYPTIPDYYYVSYRQPIGAFDTSLQVAQKSGASIHIWNDQTAWNTYAIDTTPGDSNFGNAALSDGKTFTDSINNIIIKQISHDANGVTLDITPSNIPICARSDQTATSLPPLSQTGKPGDVKTYSVTVTNNDSSACGASTFNVYLSPITWTNNTASLTLNPGASGTVSRTVTPPAGTTDGSYPFGFITGDSNHQIITAPGYTYVVQAGPISTAYASLSETTLNIKLSSTTDTTISTSGTSIIVNQGSQPTASFPSTSVTSIVVNGTSATENFYSDGTVTQPITLNTGAGGDTLFVTAGTYTMNSDPSPGSTDLAVIIYQGANLIFNSNAHLGALIDQGTATIAQNGSRVVFIKNLSMPTTSSKVDLKDNDLVYEYSGASPIGIWDGTKYTLIQGWVASGRGGGTWNGTTGITSSIAATKSGLTTVGVAEASKVFSIFGTQTATIDGQTIDATAVVAKYTYSGDLNLDGKIDISDYGTIDFNTPIHTTGYSQGDINYDGKIDILDYGIIDFNIPIQGPQL
jgi:hypothetical protein